VTSLLSLQSAKVLQNLKHIISLRITDHFIQNIENVNKLHNLKFLAINTFCKTKIHFENFPYLERCFIEWRTKAKSIFNCKTLKRLYINKYKGKESLPFANLLNLEHLHLGNTPLYEIENISSLNKLEFLQISYCRNLSSLKGIDKLVNLKGLGEIVKCCG
jgi:hypothetical protein